MLYPVCEASVHRQRNGDAGVCIAIRPVAGAAFRKGVNGDRVWTWSCAVVGRRRSHAAPAAAARHHDRSLLVLDTVTESAGYRLYERLGWRRVGDIPDYALFPDGRFCDTTIFYKRIAP